MVRPVTVQKEAPPPPPINPNQDTVPEVAPRELPKLDQSMAFAAPAGSGSGTGTGTVGAIAGASGPAITGSGNTAKVMDIEFSQMKVTYKPPAPPYPTLAKIAKIQGTVVVVIIVGTDGVPTSAHATEGPMQLRAASEQYAMQWKFEPAMQNGVPQVARFTLTMPYHLH
jgi:protein TonB